jgi:hypothetical protein
MAKPGLGQIATNDKFETWLNRTNDIVSIIASDAVTASPLGDTTVGNATLIGNFSANTVIAENTLRADTISPRVGSTVVTVSSPVTISSATQNLQTLSSANGPRMQYTTGATTWRIGFLDGTTNSSFIIDTGTGASKFAITPSGNVTIAGNLTGNVIGNSSTSSAWQTPRNIGIGNTQKLVDGSADVSWSIAEIGAVPAVRNINTSNGISGGSNLNSDVTLSLSGQALALHNLATNGLVTRTSAGAISARTITGTANQISIINGDGVSGNPTISAVIASQADAEAGADNVKLMTSLRTKQLVAFGENNITGGYTATEKNNGVISSGTYSPTPVGGNFMRIVNGGSFTMAAPTASGSYTLVVLVTNSSTAGAIVMSGFNRVTGTFTITNNHRFIVYITKVFNFVFANIQALQ